HIKDIMWLNSSGLEMTEQEWLDGQTKHLAVILSGNIKDVVDQEGNPMTDDTFLVCFNAWHDPVTFTLPSEEGMEWELVLDTHEETGFVEEVKCWGVDAALSVGARSMLVLKL